MLLSRYLVILFIILSTHISFANELHYNYNGTSYKISPEYDQDHYMKKVSICYETSEQQQQCQSYPKGNNSLFKGKAYDWNKFFNRCSGFNHANILFDANFVLTTLAALPAMGFWKTVAAEALFLSIPVTPYPNIEAAALESAKEITSYILKNNNKGKKVPASLVLSYSKIMQACSYKFEQSLINKKSSECLSSCHALKAERSKEIKAFTFEERILSNEILEYYESIK